MNEIIQEFLLARNIASIGDIRWAHAVNSRQLLLKVLENPDIDFLEIDISISKNNEPIAAHYSDRSDLTFADLLNKVKHSQKGLKFDFKDQETVATCITLLNKTNLTQPVIINSDILSLEYAPEPVIDPEFFIKTCVVNYPRGLLSLGWRTTSNSRYEEGDIHEMLVLCKNLKGVTFPVRASALPGSWSNVIKLAQKENHSLTIWNGEPASPDLQKWIEQSTDKQRCFYDLT